MAPVNRSIAIATLAALAGCAAPAAPPVPDAALAGDAAVPGGDAAPALDAPPDACAPVLLEPAASDRLLLVDTSGSWTRRADRWAGARDAVIAAVGASSATHALLTFPRFDGTATPAVLCDAQGYRALDLDWPAGSDAVADALGAVALEGESPLGAALEGAIETARVRARAMPDRSSAIVLVTDATPGDDEACASGAWEEVAAIAGRGFADGLGASVHVHVLSVMGTAVSVDHAGRLATIADEGGGFAAFVNGGRADVARSAGEVLRSIDDRMRTCSLRLPEGFLPQRMFFTFDDGTEQVLERVPDASFCEGTPGGFYVDDERAPHLATVCSGEAGIGGVCESLFLRARALGAPAVSATACGL